MRLLGKGEITAAVTVEVAGASQAAIAAVEKAGGKVDIKAPPAPAKTGKRTARKAAAREKAEQAAAGSAEA